ncbi:MAG: alpha/beta fold hydrolase [Actinobacteria bacterium]|nr:alpha/beta fold hydrolase [Actinomycetota bacterium]
MPEQVWPDAEPFAFEGGNTGVLVVHGFTGCTQSMLPLGEGLAAAGYTVVGPRLPGHGTSVKDMSTRKWDEWTGEAEKSLLGLLDRCDKVFVTGLSMGGTITCYLGERYAGKLAGIMPINAAVEKLNPFLPLTPVVKYVLKTIPGVGSDIKDPEVEESCYDKVPVPAAAELHALMKLTRRDLDKITEPILVFTSREDNVVPPSNGPYILDNVSSKDKELVWLENSYHVATLDYDKQLIIDRCVEFIRRLS